MLGTTLRGRYEIVRQLGKGGFSETFLAYDKDLPGKPYCVVKQLKPPLTASWALQTATRLFDREAQVLYKLGNHDQIPRLLAHFEENGEFYLVQEYIEGDVLSREFAQGRQWSADEVITFLHDILKTLEFVHQQNVIHRDIKPANLIRRALDRKLVLIDFGAVKEINSLGANSQGKTIIGTPGYMPSEQVTGNPHFSSDIYALGITAIQAFTGILPEQLPKSPETHEVVWRHLVQVKSELADILDKMVRYDFRQRYQSVNEVLQALSSLVPQTKPKWWQNRKLVLALVLVIIVPCILLLVRPEIGQIFGFSPNDSSLTKYDSSNFFGIRMKYPKSWGIQKIEDRFTGDVAKFFPLQKSDLKSLQPELSVEKQDLKKPISLPDYTNSRVNEITQFLTNPRIHDSRATKLANLSAHEVVYTGKQEQHHVKMMAVWTVKDSKAYIVTYTAEESQYDAFLKTAQAMINSLEIRENTPTPSR
ncbi:serine/threonine-protein kinase [Brasilonema sp. UFV-L1]|uniref:serine/threonine-protein kinase n=1 Tax=Brasilonema sp. UFV-L1 TaxID=2234130 RepID=UPI00145F4503|nr:serine/threonine-protein kinase [Brasilonema sp. UFV-L1]NMG08211.1 serine/threonine protein kinase [Brasilonema sp. UFV-L1]